MKKLAFCITFVLCCASFSLNAGYNFEETVSIPLPKLIAKWKLGYQDSKELGVATARYILDHESMNTWTELVNIQFKDKKLITCTDAVSAMKQETMLNRSVIFKIHKAGTHDLIFEKIFPTGEHEIVRMIMTAKGLHRVAYVKRDALFTDGERAQWIERLSSGTIEKR